MELVLEGSPLVHTEGTVTIELPAYMKLLSDEELAVAKTTPNRDKLILGAGRHPRTQEIVFLSGIGEIRAIDTIAMNVPPGPASPTDHGQTIHLELEGCNPFEVSADWAFRVSYLLINVGTLADKKGARVSYLDQ